MWHFVFYEGFRDFYLGVYRKFVSGNQPIWYVFFACFVNLSLMEHGGATANRFASKNMVISLVSWYILLANVYVISWYILLCMCVCYLVYRADPQHISLLYCAHDEKSVMYSSCSANQTDVTIIINGNHGCFLLRPNNLRNC